MRHRVPHRLPLGGTGPLGLVHTPPGPTVTESEPGRVVTVPVERRWSPRVHAAANTAHDRSEDAADAGRDAVVRGHAGGRTRPRHPRAARGWRTANIRAMLAP